MPHLHFRRPAVILSLALIAGTAMAYRRTDIPVTRWIAGNAGDRPGTFAEWQEANPPSPESRTKLRLTRGGRFDPRLDIVVNATLYDSIAPCLDTLCADIAAEGLAVSVFTAAIARPDSLRRFLQGEYAAGMTGALLIGSLPVAWFQMIDEWNGNGARDPGEGYEEFPCDLFYMDLNGTWLDTMHRLSGQDSLVSGLDGIYDQHDGDLVPEIWLGRITARPCGNEKTLVNDYLRKVHAYRCDELGLNDRALVFVDDDWVPWASEFAANVGLLYPERVLIADPETTQATRYRVCLAENYEWLGVFSHSSSRLHAMKFHGDSWSYFYEQEIPTRNPVAHFYNLFACSNSRYTDTGYMGGRYIYSTSTGLNSVGTTKTGSMLDFNWFYSALGAGQHMGEAMMTWFTEELAPGYDPVARSWFYGMSLNGDPTLKPRVRFHDVGVSAIIAPAGNVDSGAAVVPVCRVTNYGLNDETFSVRFRIGADYDETRAKPLPRGASDTVCFPVWIASPVGTIVTRCSTELSQDQRPDNDAARWSVTVLPPSGVADANRPKAFALFEPTPNPARGLARVRYALPHSAPVRLALYDCQGSLVRTMVSGRGVAGIHDLAVGSSRAPLAAGIYLLRFEAGTIVQTRQLVILP